MVVNTTPGSIRRHRASESDVSEFDSNVNNLRIAFQKIKKIKKSKKVKTIYFGKKK